jgi:hypothetical protein
MTNYKDFFELLEFLEKEQNLIPSPSIVNFDWQQFYATMMDIVAQPLPDGSPSPFTSRLPGSVHDLLIQACLYISQIQAHQIDLIPDKTLTVLYRMLGYTRLSSEYPIVGMEFTRSHQSKRAGFDAVIPIGTKVLSRINPSVYAVTQAEGRIVSNQDSIVVPARLSQLGYLSRDTQVGEFNKLNRPISQIESVQNVSVISEGKKQETLPEMVLRTRQLIQTGNRCVTVGDYEYFAKYVIGASKVNVIPGYLQDSVGAYFSSSIVTVVLYPETLVDTGKLFFEGTKMADVKVNVVPAEIIPIDGKVTVRVIPSLLNNSDRVFNLGAKAILDKINPPNGRWGNLSLDTALATALELVEGFYAVPSIELKHADDDTPLNGLDIKPYHLFQIQNSLEINAIA